MSGVAGGAPLYPEILEAIGGKLGVTHRSNNSVSAHGMLPHLLTAGVGTFRTTTSAFAPLWGAPAASPARATIR
jgi:hypothetical protein